MQKNAYAWNRRANMLFLESPAFVGFSYSNTTADRIVGDARTAADARKFLLEFVGRFPHLADNALYLSGERYGSVCMCGQGYGSVCMCEREVRKCVHV